jgi:hypothetical protein
MGLDQYANAHKGEQKKDEDGYTYYDDNIELAYWRKHPNLQGFMEELWIEKGKPNANVSSDKNQIVDEFNCVDLELGHYDLIKLEEAIKDSELPETGGFFFGDDSDEYYKEDTLDFVEQAKMAIDDGYTVVYSSWW